MNDDAGHAGWANFAPSELVLEVVNLAAEMPPSGTGI